MKPITNRTELRWYLEDMGDEHKALRQYVLDRFAYYDEVLKLAEYTITRLSVAERLCKIADLDDLSADVQDTISEIGNTVHDVKEGWKYIMEDA